MLTELHEQADAPTREANAAANDFRALQVGDGERICAGRQALRAHGKALGLMSASRDAWRATAERAAERAKIERRMRWTIFALAVLFLVLEKLVPVGTKLGLLILAATIAVYSILTRKEKP